MKKRLLSAFLVVLFFAIPIARAEVIEEARMERALSYVDEGTLLIFDIDNTLVEPAQMLGSDQWYYYLVEKYIKEGMDKKDATKKVDSIWKQIEHVTEVQPVEPATPRLIREIQDRGIKVMALTLRPKDLAKATVKKLQSVGIDFNRQPVYKKGFSMEPKYKGSVYYNGILFSGLTADKGVILNDFLRKIEYTTKRVVFVDDKLSNIEKVDRALSANGIKCLCIRYGAADKTVKSFNPAIAGIELEFFGKVLSDEAARAILNLYRHKK